MKTTNEAIRRLAYTISKEHKPNETDKLALNTIITFINKSDEQVIQEHGLFAKLYIHLLQNFLIHYDYDIEFASKQLHKELQYPLMYHIELLTNHLKSGEMSRLFKEKGIVDDFYKGKPFSEASILYQQNKEVFPEINGKELLSSAEFWDIDNVSAQLTRQINEALTRYKND